jgi:hypothetical protein
MLGVEEIDCVLWLFWWYNAVKASRCCELLLLLFCDRRPLGGGDFEVARLLIRELVSISAVGSYNSAFQCLQSTNNRLNAKAVTTSSTSTTTTTTVTATTTTMEVRRKASPRSTSFQFHSFTKRFTTINAA